MCAVVSSAFPQAHVVSPVYNFHFFLCALLQVNPVRRRLRHLHVVIGHFFRISTQTAHRVVCC